MVAEQNKMSNKNESYLAALYLQKNGISVVPERNKKPLLKGWGQKNFPKIDMPKYSSPDIMWGVCGGDGLYAIDIDIHDKQGNKNPKWTSESQECLDSLIGIKDAVWYKTPSDNIHILFRGDAGGIKTIPEGFIAPCIEVKGLMRGVKFTIYENVFKRVGLSDIPYINLNKLFPKVNFDAIEEYKYTAPRQGLGYIHGNRNVQFASDLGVAKKRGDVYKALNAVYQYCKAGGTQAELEGTVKKQLEYIESERSTENLEIEMLTDDIITGPKWAIDEWFQKGTLALIGGEKGGGKSTFVLNLIANNANKNPLWEGGPVGNGDPSMYIALETSPSDARDKVIGAGGTVEKVHIVTKIGGERVDLQDDRHIQVLVESMRKNNYFAVVIDPIVELVLSSQNDNALIRQQVNKILDQLYGLDTFILGTAHLKKERGKVSEVGAFRGGSEIVNMSRGVFRIYDMEDDSGKILIRFDVNNSKFSNVGGLRFKITGIERQNYEGDRVELPQIAKITYTNAKQAVLLKEVKQDKPELKQDKKDPTEVLKQVIAEFKAQGKPLIATEIKAVANAREPKSVTTYWLKYKLDWNEAGYQESRSSAIDKIILTPNGRVG